MHKELWTEKLAEIYGDENIAQEITEELQQRLKRFTGKISRKKNRLDEQDSILITYGDTIQKEGELPLATLHHFLNTYVQQAISTVHILPMFPYSSDDGFSVVDYTKINPELGTWNEVSSLSKDYSLMFDAVVNHASRESLWFAKFLRGEHPYDQFFITCDPAMDYHKVIRPRTLPLLTKFTTSQGDAYVWTTFSEDQIDLNYHCPELLLAIIEILLSYAEQGARFIRLDAIGFIWKEQGTNCMNLPQVHSIIQLFRLVLADYAPETLLVTEANVPQQENLTYFGNGGNEANMIYQFALPPLVMYTMLTGDATHLTFWAQRIKTPEDGTTYLNFLSSHDGIGLRPLEGILTKSEQQILVDATLHNGGTVSYKNNEDGTRSPYELNINYQDALASPNEPDRTRIKRFLAAETILLSLQGIPGIYIHSLLGLRNDYFGRITSGIPRRINREKISEETLESVLTEDTNQKLIFQELIKRLNIRKTHPAFSPVASQTILDIDKRVFSLVRNNREKKEQILVIANISNQTIKFKGEFYTGIELFTDIAIKGLLVLQPYQTAWIVQKQI